MVLGVPHVESDSRLSPLQSHNSRGPPSSSPGDKWTRTPHRGMVGSYLVELRNGPNLAERSQESSAPMVKTTRSNLKDHLFF